MSGYRGSLVLTPGIRVACGAIGVAIFGTGVGAVFWTQNGAGSAALVAIGAAFFGLAALGERIERLELGGATLTIRDLARETFALASEAEQRGDDEAASRLRLVGRQLQKLASHYHSLRSVMRAGHERTIVLELLMDETRRLSAGAALEPDDVLRWYDRGTPEARITALGLMEGDGRLGDFGAAIDAIGHSRSAFEQYHGLVLAQKMLRNQSFGAVEQKLLGIAVERALGHPRLRGDSNRRRVGREILAELDAPSRI